MEERLNTIEEITCASCGCIIDPEDAYEVDGDYYCEECFYEEFAVCERCGKVIPQDDAIPVYNLRGDIIEYVCDDCVDDYSNDSASCRYAYCAINGKVYRKVDMRRLWYRGENFAGDSVYNKVWVNDFAYDELYYCDDCGNYVSADDWDADYGCCNDCAADRREEDGVICDYHDHHGCWECYGKREDLFGIELEVEGVGDISRNDCAEWLDDHFNDMVDSHVAFEKDGSLSDDGFEIISHPHDWESFNALDWQRALEYMSENGFKSHDTTTCGLHIHVNRRMFGENSDEQYENLAKVCYFYSVAWTFFLKLSRRTQAQADAWAREYVQDNYSEAKTKVRDDDEMKNCSRYSAINLTNRDTIEFRLGRGTLRYKSFRAWIDLHLTIVRNAKNIDDFSLRNVAMWLDGIEENTLEYIRYRDAFDLVGGEPTTIETREMKEANK